MPMPPCLSFAKPTRPYAYAPRRRPSHISRPTGFPVMVKPIAGGGGIGMQAVRAEGQLRESLARARRVAAGSFGDERLLIERLVERPRHVEVQVVADDRGNVVTYPLRDCSA